MDDEFQNLINRFRDFPVIERKPSFLEIARYPHREIVWRNILAFFFDPNECHGFKDLFLRSFFDALGKQDQDTENFNSIIVETECQTPNGKYLDLLITCDKFAIGIEMKVNANLNNDLKAYGKLVKASRPDDEHKVVLSVKPCPAHSGFTNLLCSDLVAAVKQQLGNYVLAADPKYMSLLSDFLNHITSYIGGYAMPIDPKQLQFMRDNRETITRLINVHNQIQKQMKENLKEIHKSVKALDSLKPFLDKDKPHLITEGGIIIAFHFVSSGVRLNYDIGVEEIYFYDDGFYIDSDQPAHEHLETQIDQMVNIKTIYDANQPIPEIVKDIEERVISIAKYIDKTINPKRARKS